jgi:hypothetical protein
VRNAWEQATQEFKCAHDESTLRYRTASNGVRTYVMQCLRCGDVERTLKKAMLTAKALDAARAFNEAQRNDWNARCQARARALQEEDNQEWWDRYNAYLRTPQWASRCRRVLARAKGQCEGCGLRPATQVHHLTYVRVTKEMLFDLVAICDDCHEHVHGHQDYRVVREMT